MSKKIFSILVIIVMPLTSVMSQLKEGSPVDNLPAYVKRLTQFGERADFSHDGKKILFLEKTYGDVYEYEISVVPSGANPPAQFGGLAYMIFVKFSAGVRPQHILFLTSSIIEPIATAV